MKNVISWSFSRPKPLYLKLILYDKIGGVKIFESLLRLNIKDNRLTGKEDFKFGHTCYFFSRRKLNILEMKKCSLTKELNSWGQYSLCVFMCVATGATLKSLIDQNFKLRRLCAFLSLIFLAVCKLQISGPIPYKWGHAVTPHTVSPLQIS